MIFVCFEPLAHSHRYKQITTAVSKATQGCMTLMWIVRNVSKLYYLIKLKKFLIIFDLLVTNRTSYQKPSLLLIRLIYVLKIHEHMYLVPISLECFTSLSMSPNLSFSVQTLFRNHESFSIPSRLQMATLLQCLVMCMKSP